jgi:hypothetical protein
MAPPPSKIARQTNYLSSGGTQLTLVTDNKARRPDDHTNSLAASLFITPFPKQISYVDDKFYWGLSFNGHAEIKSR